MPAEADDGQDWLVGEYARIRSQETRGRAIASAKSWLCHSGVDRLGPILPWGAGELANTPQLSPVEASRRLLEHVRRVFEAREPNLDLAQLSVVLTVPAERYAGASSEQMLEDIRSQRNVVIEMIATLKAVKPIRAPGSQEAAPVHVTISRIANAERKPAWQNPDDRL